MRGPCMTWPCLFAIPHFHRYSSHIPNSFLPQGLHISLFLYFHGTGSSSSIESQFKTHLNKMLCSPCPLRGFLDFTLFLKAQLLYKDAETPFVIFTTLFTTWILYLSDFSSMRMSVKSQDSFKLDSSY